MRQIVLILLALLGLASSDEIRFERAAENKLKVSVYYETLCGDSKRFITTQLYPAKKSSLGDYFDFELIPYGKATTTSEGGTFTFRCQHGSAECDGNKMHACALKYIPSVESQLEFIYCSMSTRNPPESLDECAKSVATVDGVKDKISTCAEGPEGSQLLADNGEKTHGLKTKLYFVPWITYNGEFSDDKLQNSQRNFKGVLCDELKANGVSPTECGPTVEKWSARRA